MNKVNEVSAGTLDSSFGDNGVVDLVSENWSVPHCILELPNGKLIYANGDRETWLRTLQLRRVNANGFFDKSFGENGSVILHIGWNIGARFGLFPYQGDKFLVKSTRLDSGQQEMVFMRLDLDGQVDTTFGGPDGTVRLHPNDLVYPRTDKQETRTDKQKNRRTIKNVSLAYEYIGGSVCVQPDGKILVAHSGLERGGV